MEFLRDYVGIFPAIVAVINGALAVFSTHFPFKTPLAKIRFIAIVGLLSFSAIGATFYSQHLVIAQKKEDAAQRGRIRDQLGTFITEGNNLMDACADKDNPPPVEAANGWLTRVNDFLNLNLGKSYVARFHDPAGIPSLSLIGGDAIHSAVWFNIYRRVSRLEQFSQEIPSS